MEPIYHIEIDGKGTIKEIAAALQNLSQQILEDEQRDEVGNHEYDDGTLKEVQIIPYGRY